MDRRVIRKALKTLRHIDQFMHPRIAVIKASEFRVHLQRLVDRDIQFHRHHLRHAVHLSIREIKCFANCFNDTSRRHGSKRRNLGHGVFAILLRHILDDTRTFRVLKVHVDIGHGYTLRIKESLKKQIVTHRIDIRDTGTVAHAAARTGTTSRSYPAVMCLGPVDIIPHDQNVLNESHLLDDAKLVFHILVDCITLFLRVGIIVRIFFLESLVAQCLQKLIRRRIPFRHFVFRDLVITKFNRYMAAIRNLLRVVDRFLRIRKKRPHLVLALDIELPAFIAHTILIRNLLARLDTKQYIMRLHIIRIGIMHVIRTHKPDSCLLAHTYQLLVYDLLIRDSVVLQLQKEIVPAETFCIL